MQDEVKTILDKYLEEEGRINKLLQEKQANQERHSIKAKEEDKKTFLSLEDAIKRNRAILKELEIVKGNLRSKAIYSPSEMQWETVVKNYLANPSLPVTARKTYTGVYV